MGEPRLRPDHMGQDIPRAEIIESPNPEELEAPEAHETTQEQMLATIEEGQTRWSRFVKVVKELPTTMKNMVGGGGMEGFRTRGVRQAYTALRLAMLLGGAAEGLKSMA
ncbi:MAG: hypothetical protein AAB431_03320, partial [Patescibacteria group bacterium]